jgi:hypothetical protein
MKKAKQLSLPARTVTTIVDREFGGTIMGLVIGLVIGLSLALAVAFYISKKPPQERPGVKAPNLPLTIVPVTPADPVASDEEKPAGQID